MSAFLDDQLAGPGANPSMAELKHEALRLLKAASGSRHSPERARNLIASADVVAKLALVAGIQEDNQIEPQIAAGITAATS